ncbi:MAG: hypothetical protein ACLQT6_17150 [Desulfomonilaceae bacterium]
MLLRSNGDDSARDGDRGVGKKNSGLGSPTYSNRISFRRVTEPIHSLGATVAAFERRIVAKIAGISNGRRSGMRR